MFMDLKREYDTLPLKALFSTMTKMDIILAITIPP